MEKETKVVFGKTYYLLGKRKEDNKKVWLEQANWDCDWYWGLGYVEIFNRNYSDINEHTHFDSLFLEHNFYDSFVDYFKETTLDKKEIWQLLELMKTLYILRDYSDTICRGGSHITTNELSELIKNDDEYNRINKIVIPKINEKIYSMLS